MADIRDAHIRMSNKKSGGLFSYSLSIPRYSPNNLPQIPADHIVPLFPPLMLNSQNFAFSRDLSEIDEPSEKQMIKALQDVRKKPRISKGDAV